MFQNASIETWIRTAKFNQKIPTRSDDISKIQTVFPRSGMHSLAKKAIEMHRPMSLFSGFYGMINQKSRALPDFLKIMYFDLN